MLDIDLLMIAVAAAWVGAPEKAFPVPAVELSRSIHATSRRWSPVHPMKNRKRSSSTRGTATCTMSGLEGMATRYGAAVGRSGFEWSGRAKIAYKREWPVWTPPT
jgi:lipoprotein-anchoring transpeptidase ErfK/SrfK